MLFNRVSSRWFFRRKIPCLSSVSYMYSHSPVPWVNLSESVRLGGQVLHLGQVCKANLVQETVKRPTRGAKGLRSVRHVCTGQQQLV